jgi:hypothetical protein
MHHSPPCHRSKKYPFHHFRPSVTMMTMNIGGSATQALEQSLKRQRTISSNKLISSTTAALEAALNLDEVFSSLLSPDEESFPSISWDFDDELETKSDSVNLTPMGLSAPKRDLECGVSLGMIRTKSLKRGLNSLACSINVSAPTKPLSEKRAPDVVADTLKLSAASIDLSKTSNSQLGMNQLTQRSRFGLSRIVRLRIAPVVCFHSQHDIK